MGRDMQRREKETQRGERGRDTEEKEIHRERHRGERYAGERETLRRDTQRKEERNTSTQESERWGGREERYHSNPVLSMVLLVALGLEPRVSRSGRHTLYRLSCLLPCSSPFWRKNLEPRLPPAALPECLELFPPASPTST